MNINITGKGKIYRTDFDGRPSYSTSIGVKQLDGTYDNMFLQVQMPKDSNVQHGDEIEITKGFLSFYRDKNNVEKIKVVVMEFTNNSAASQMSEVESYQGDELPF